MKPKGTDNFVLGHGVTQHLPPILSCSPEFKQTGQGAVQVRLLKEQGPGAPADHVLRIKWCVVRTGAEITTQLMVCCSES
jgi:hypothetical protein